LVKLAEVEAQNPVENSKPDCKMTVKRFRIEEKEQTGLFTAHNETTQFESWLIN